jgi:hypothetical protein
MKSNGFLSKFRFTLGETLCVITVVAACTGAFANDSHVAELALRYLAICLVLAASLRALFNGPARRPFASGFVLATLLHWTLAVNGPHQLGAAESILGLIVYGQQHYSQMNTLHISLSLAFGFLAGLTARLFVSTAFVNNQCPPT